MTDNNDVEGKIIQAKHSLYGIYYDIMSEIQDKKIEINQKDYQKKIKTSRVETIISSIKAAIQTLLEKRVNNPEEPIIEDNRSLEEKLKEYEPVLRYYEETMKRQYKRIIKLKMQKEGLEMTIDNYKEMEEDYEQQKEKLKYEDGKFLNNDRKDNEILILRAENSNLKSVMHKINESQKEIDNRKKKSGDTISSLQLEIEKMTKKLSMLEHHRKDLTSAPGSSNNSSINININNLGNQGSNWFLQNEEENTNMKNSKRQCDSDREPPLSERSNIAYLYNHDIAQFEARMHMINRKNKGQEKSALVDSNACISTYNRIINEIGEKPNKNSTYHQKNSSMGMQEKKRNDPGSKYFSNHISNHPSNQTTKPQSNNIYSYVKISNGVPNSKAPITNRAQNQYQHMNNTMNKLLIMNHSGSKSANRSSLNIRSSSKGDN